MWKKWWYSPNKGIMEYNLTSTTRWEADFTVIDRSSARGESRGSYSYAWIINTDDLKVAVDMTGGILIYRKEVT
jgi:hypothetical protein